MSTLIPQILNLNGSNGGELVGQYCDILTALRKAQEAIQRGMPHGRDYQTSREAWAHTRAQDAFRERWAELDAMHKEFEAAALNVQEQIREREKKTG